LTSGRFVAALLTAAALAGCGTTVRNPVTGENERTVMTEPDEIAYGARAHAQIVQEYGELKNPALQAYVDGVGRKLAAQSHRAQLPWKFTVLDSPEVNAFALPGGYIYITRGIMAYLDSEADLAGVLGHEIGHVTARHGAQQATRQQRAGLGVIAATIGGVLLEAAGVGGAAQAASQVAQGVAAGHIAKYGREAETQADRLGAEYLARTRYDPTNMIDVIQVLKDQERFAADAARAAGRTEPAAPGWLASHPSNDQRLADIRGLAQQLATRTPGQAPWDDDGRARYLRAIEGVTFGDSAEQGVVRGRSFFHEGLGIAMTAPPLWRINNGAEQVLFVNGAGDAGLVMRTVPASAGTDHARILREGLGATEGRTEKLTLGGGLPATFFTGQRRNAQGQVSALEATLVTGPQNTVYLLGRVARDAATLAAARGALREVELSFRPLDAADRAAARPYKLKVVPMPAGGFAELARGSPLAAGAAAGVAAGASDAAERQLRLLNGAYAGSSAPKAGQLVKTIGH
jgi:predicted Zn-dependent protease